jgi:flagellar basal body rod protein FlgG
MSDRIFEIGEAGLQSTDEKVKKLMDNLVGSEVPGYKKQDVVVRAFPLLLEDALQRLSSMKPQADDSFYNMLQGALVKTGGSLDVALGAEGFFVIQGPWGEGYTRDGRFHLDKDGQLLSVSGNFPVMGKMGAITVPPGSQVEFSGEGDIKVDGIVIDRLQVVQPTDYKTLEILNGSIFKVKTPNAILLDVDEPRVIQGYVEGSNVDVVDMMTQMIYLERMYNLNAKIVQTRDQNLARAMELGRPNQ